MKLYTRSGDDGTTGLFGGQRVGKDHARVAAYGEIDELNAAIGLALAAIAPGPADEGQTNPLPTCFTQILLQLQSRLFDIGADLATPPGSKHEDKIVRFSDAHVAEAEAWIDEIDAGNDPMRQFILPGGTELAARLHLARAVCRRAERAMVALNRSEPVTPAALTFINRISDLLFAMARRANKHAGIADVPWTPGRT